MMHIPLVDLKAQYDSIKGEIDSALKNVLERTEFILGPEVSSFESEIAAYCDTKFAAGVASGTDALHLALIACGINPGDEVITTPFTFIATAEVITLAGAVPVFADIEPETHNINPAKIAEKITSRTRAIMPVHLFGQPCDMDPILEIAKKYNLKVIEDCAQALGAEYKGKRVGAIGDAGCFSFFPSKILGAFGDGGMLATSDAGVAEKVRMLRNHGCKEKYYHLIPGFNSRLDSLQAAILRVKLRHLDEWKELRHRKGALYSKLLSDIKGVVPPLEKHYSKHIFNYYTIRLKNAGSKRDALRKYLRDNGVDSAVYYPLSLHLQEVYRSLRYKAGDFPESEKAQEEVLSLPLYPELRDGQIEKVAGIISKFMESQS